MNEITEKDFGSCVISLLYIIFKPLILIWGMNLLGFGIPYTMETWFGAVLLLLILRQTTFNND